MPHMIFLFVMPVKTGIQLIDCFSTGFRLLPE
jgi:hypothetical protein